MNPLRRIPQLLIWGLLLTASVTFAQEVLTLETTIQQVLANNGTVRQSEQAQQGAAARLDQSAAGLWPSLNLSAGYTRIGPIPEFNISGRSLAMGVADNVSLGAAVQYPLFTWGRIVQGIDIARTSLTLSQKNTDLARSNAGYQAATLFYGILFSREALGLYDRSLQSFRERLGTANVRYQAGLGSSFDTLTIAVQIDGVLSRRLDAETGLRKLEMTLNQLRGQPSDVRLELQGSLEADSPDPDRESSLTAARVNRIELQQLGLQETLANRSIGLASTYNKPSLNLSGAYNFKNGQQPDIQKLQGSWSVGAALSYPIFDGFRTNASVREAESNLRGVQLVREDMVRAIQLDVDQSLADVQAGREKVRLTEQQVRQAEEALRIADLRHADGFLSTLDLLDTQNSLESARIALLQAKYTLILSRFALDKATGHPLTTR